MGGAGQQVARPLRAITVDLLCRSLTSTPVLPALLSVSYT